MISIAKNYYISNNYVQVKMLKYKLELLQKMKYSKKKHEFINQKIHC